MSVHRAAAARRARLRELLRAKTQAETAYTQREILEQLGSSVTVRTLQRDLDVLRGHVGKATGSKRAQGANRAGVRSNVVMKTVKNIDARLDAIENVQRNLVDFLAKITDFAVESRNDDLKLLAITNEAAADRAELHGKVERVHDLFTAAVDAADYGEHTNH